MQNSERRCEAPQRGTINQRANANDKSSLEAERSPEEGSQSKPLSACLLRHGSSILHSYAK